MRPDRGEVTIIVKAERARPIPREPSQVLSSPRAQRVPPGLPRPVEDGAVLLAAAAAVLWRRERAHPDLGPQRPRDPVGVEKLYPQGCVLPGRGSFILPTHRLRAETHPCPPRRCGARTNTTP